MRKYKSHFSQPRNWAANIPILFLAFMLTGCVTPVVKQQVRPVDKAMAERLDGTWIAAIGEDRPFRFAGEYLDSNIANGYQMLYPAPDFATFLVGVATHAALQSAQTESHNNAQRLASDKVLIPYKQILDEMWVHSTFKNAVQIQNSRVEIVDLSDVTNSSEIPVIDLAAHSIMAQSQRALIVDLVARIKNPSSNEDDSGYVHKVRVISNPIEIDEDKIISYWLDDNGHKIKQTVTHLLAQAIDLFIDDATQHLHPIQEKQITARYKFGLERRIERASLLNQSCTRLTLRTLRGWVLSVPAPENLNLDKSCMEKEIVSHHEAPSA
jgi:hypothetical protein